MKQNIIAISLLSTVFLATHATAAGYSAFSPYQDVTINAHWDSKTNSMQPMSLLPVSEAGHINSYHLAFITDAGSCQPAWGAQSSYAVSAKWGTQLTDSLRANEIAYIVSFGGASGDDISKACSEAQLIAALDQVMQTYQPQGLDFDIENGSTNVPKLMQALSQFQNHYPTTSLSFTLPVLPEGLTGEGKSVVLKAKESGLNFHVNIMAMDFGPAYTNDMGEYAIQAATALNQFLTSLYPEKSPEAIWGMIEVTPMIGVNDVNVEQFTLTNADTLRRFASKNALGGLSMWSVMRDHPCADHWASPICSGNDLQKTPYEFARMFVGLIDRKNNNS